MLTTILIVIAVAIVAVLAFAATKPNTFMIRRSAAMAAPAERIFPMIDDLHAQSAWSPFEKDPNMKRSHSGPARGKGAVYAWDGNRQVGAGRLAITDSVAPSKVLLRLEMVRPFAAQNTVEFALVPLGGGTNVTGTNVTWSMQGRQPFLAKLFGLFVNCDKMVGAEFEEGLAKLKTLVEGDATPIAAE